MTIAKTDARKQYAGDNVTTAFSFPYRFFADSDLQVYLLVDATGVETLQTLITNYTVTNNGDETGGTVTMLTSPAVGETLTLLRSIPQTQGTDYAANDAFPAETHEDALDRVTLLVQQLQEEVARSLIAPVSDTASLELPIDRALKFLAFDASKNPIASAGTIGTTPIIVSTFMETVLDDTTAAAARTTLGAGTLSNVVEDTTPQLGAMLDVNTFGFGDGTLELLSFTEVASAVNELTITNAATGGGPILSATGDDTNVDLNVTPKGSGRTKLTSPNLIVGSDADGDVYYRSGGNLVRLAKGTAKQVQRMNAGATAPEWSEGGRLSAILQDQKASGTDGGTFTSGAWQIRDLNTEAYDPNSLISITTNKFTPVNDGYVEWGAPAAVVTSHMSRLYNVTDSVVVEYGRTDKAHNDTQVMTFSVGIAAVIAGKEYRIEHRCAVTRATNGYGYAQSFGVANVYTYVWYWSE